MMARLNWLEVRLMSLVRPAMLALPRLIRIVSAVTRLD